MTASLASACLLCICSRCVRRSFVRDSGPPSVVMFNMPYAAYGEVLLSVLEGQYKRCGDAAAEPPGKERNPWGVDASASLSCVLCSCERRAACSASGL